MKNGEERKLIKKEVKKDVSTGGQKNNKNGDVRKEVERKVLRK